MTSFKRARRPVVTGRPNGPDQEGFYSRVAAAYKSAMAIDARKPGKVIAEASGVPVATVHRWIQEARSRNLLPPGRQGVAGETTVLERIAADLGVEVDRLRAAVKKHGRADVS